MIIAHIIARLKRLFTAWKDYLVRVEKDYFIYNGLKKTLVLRWVEKDYLWVEKDYLRLHWLWSNCCRIVSLFLITCHTFNQSMNKNIWMTYNYKIFPIWNSPVHGYIMHVMGTSWVHISVIFISTMKQNYGAVLHKPWTALILKVYDLSTPLDDLILCYGDKNELRQV